MERHEVRIDGTGPAGPRRRGDEVSLVLRAGGGEIDLVMAFATAHEVIAALLGAAYAAQDWRQDRGLPTGAAEPMPFRLRAGLLATVSETGPVPVELLLGKTLRLPLELDRATARLLAESLAALRDASD